MFTSKYNYKYAHGAEWLLIFFHNATDKTLFKDPEEASNCNTQNKFSILNELSPFMKFSGQYEFLLEYPKDYPNDYIRWSQSKLPLDDIEKENVNESIGFNPISVPSYPLAFTGLVKTNLSIKISGGDCLATLLDGNPGTNLWHYSIGMYSTCDFYYGDDQPPGPDCGVSEIYLWIRVFFIPRITNYITYKLHYHLLMTMIMIFHS